MESSSPASRSISLAAIEPNPIELFRPFKKDARPPWQQKEATEDTTEDERAVQGDGGDIEDAVEQRLDGKSRSLAGWNLTMKGTSCLDFLKEKSLGISKYGTSPTAEFSDDDIEVGTVDASECLRSANTEELGVDGAKSESIDASLEVSPDSSIDGIGISIRASDGRLPLAFT